MDASDTDTAGAEGKHTGRRILVAEDSSITKDLLELVLSRRGFVVDSAADGPSALKMLFESDYDVALVDYHLPGLNGLDLVARYDEAGRPHRPRFVAVTGDIEGLLAKTEQSARFDAVAPKPIDIDEIFQIITQPDMTPAVAAPPASAVAPGTPPTHPIFGLGYAFLTLPEGLDAGAAKALAHAGGVLKSFDAVAVTGPVPANVFARLWALPGGHLLPVVDLGGTLGTWADLDYSGAQADPNAAVGQLISDFRRGRAELSADLLAPEDMGEKLIGRLYVSGRGLTPRHSDADEMLVRYDLPVPARQLADAAQKLVHESFLSASFFDRVHVCPSCGGAHFNVREECPACGSPELTEEAYLHHFSCAYQGPESDFRSGDDLICPKCGKSLRHFGHDYDRPGMLLTCGACGHATTEPTVGFLCVHCGAHTDGEAVPTRDLFSYALTDRGTGFAEVGQAFFGVAQKSLRFADLPLDLIVALNAAARLHNEDGTPFALIDIAYRAAREIDRTHGPHRLDQARSLFTETLVQALGRPAKNVGGPARDFVLVPETEADTVRGEVARLTAAAARTVQLALDPVLSVYGPKDLF